MNWLNYIMDFVFWPMMIFAPAVWLSCVRTPPGVEVDRNEITRLTRWVWFFTLLAAAAFVALWILWEDFPRPMMLGAIAPAFSLTLRALPLKNPDWNAHDPKSQTRSASLVNRRPTSPVTRVYWIIAWVLTIGMISAVAARGLLPLVESPGRNERVLWLSALGTVAFNLFAVGMAMWAVNKTREEPEPRDAANNPDLDQSYASLRNFRAWSFYWLFAITMPVVFGGISIVMAWLPMDGTNGGWLGLVGGLLGSVIGIAGAIFGTVAGLRRVRINRELRELQNEDQVSGVA